MRPPRILIVEKAGDRGFKSRPGLHKTESILKRARVGNIAELATRNADNINAKILKINEEKKLVRRPPTLEDVNDWIDKRRRFQERLNTRQLSYPIYDTSKTGLLQFFCYHTSSLILPRFLVMQKNKSGQNNTQAYKSGGCQARSKA